MVLVKTGSYWGKVGAGEDFKERWPGSGFKRVSARGGWGSMIALGKQLYQVEYSVLYTFSFAVSLLGSYNRKKESRMAVAKGQGREKPAKIEQGRSKDRSEDLR